MAQCRAVVIAVGCLAATAAVAAPPPPPAAPTVERILILRHGEKPPAGLGQLACKGLSRALALPDVIIPKYGTPQVLFAPNPGRRKPDNGQLYNYIRPLATIEPLAIRAGLPVDTQFGFDSVLPLARTIDAPQYAGKFVVVAWEHNLLVPMMRSILKHHGADPKQIADWKHDDFDRLDVIEITRGPGKKSAATYMHGQQGLNGISDECPRGK